MINLAAAKSAALSKSTLKSRKPLDEMAKNTTQNIGVYDLIFPYLHEDYPTRKEIDMLVKDSFNSHHQSNWHLPLSAVTPSPGSPIGLPGTTSLMPVQLENREKIVGEVKVRAGSPVNKIGYGI